MHTCGDPMNFGATILGVDGVKLTKDEFTFFRDADPFGFILFSRNIDTPDQVYGLCSELRDAVGRNAIITIDQEGYLVANGDFIEPVGPAFWERTS